MIVATPLDLPPIVPDDWTVFWNIWNNNAGPLIKTHQNRDESYAAVGEKHIWKGLDIYKKNLIRVAWDAPFYDIQKDLPLMYDQIKKNPIFHVIDRIRIIESLQYITPHTDDDANHWNFRAMFSYTDTSPNGFFTKPGNINDISFFQLPTSTNWFAYHDKNCWHGSIYNPDHPKLLIQVYGLVIKDKDLIKRSIEKYKDYTISYD